MTVRVLESKLWYLQRVNLFQEMTGEEMRELERTTRMESVKKRSAVFLPGEPSRHVYLLKTGRVKISRVSEEGREVTLALLEPGEIFGELEVLDDSPRDTIAEALDDSAICLIPREQFLALVRLKPELSFRLTKLIGSRLRKIETRVEDLVFRDVPSRLAHLLVQLADEHGRTTARGIHIDIKITHQEIANLIGSTRETVSAALGDLKKAGLIDFEDRSITLLRPDVLKRRSGASSSLASRSRQ
ncbi:MAG: Crp/Fnr family transcriptional regulator [Nitrospirae bacterium]|nr:Crp/Fnr family transcriptional regulator [Nitrospirota bacterium]